MTENAKSSFFEQGFQSKPLTEEQKVEMTNALFDDVVRNVDIPQILPATIPRIEPILTAADMQTAAINRIAENMRNAVDFMEYWERQKRFHQDRMYVRFYDLCNWLKFGIVCLGVIALASGVALWVR